MIALTSLIRQAAIALGNGYVDRSHQAKLSRRLSKVKPYNLVEECLAALIYNCCTYIYLFLIYLFGKQTNLYYLFVGSVLREDIITHEFSISAQNVCLNPPFKDCIYRYRYI